MFEAATHTCCTSCCDAGREVGVAISRGARPNQFVRAVGSDIAAGQTVLQAGRVIGAVEVGLMATVGCTSVAVVAPPVVGVVSTGDELVAPDATDVPAGKIRDSNRLMLLAAVREAGGVAKDCGTCSHVHEGAVCVGFVVG